MDQDRAIRRCNEVKLKFCLQIVFPVYTGQWSLCSPVVLLLRCFCVPYLGNELADEYVGGNEPPISRSSSG